MKKPTFWPSAALKKMVIGKAKVANEDLQKSYEANYGPRVRCRVIVMSNQRRAQEVWDLARQKPTAENFAKLAQEYSADPGSRSLGGIVPPIQRHGGQPTLEKEAFALKPGEMSGVIQVGENYVIMFCEGYTKPVVVKMAEVRDLLYEDIFEKKQRLAMAAEFEQIMDRAEIVNFLEPDESRTAKKAAPAKTRTR